MPDFIQSCQGHDIGYLRIVARFWEIDLTATDKDSALKELAAALLNPHAVAEIIDLLPADARSALAELVKADGKLPWAAFVRRFGDIREAGPGQRDRELIFLHPGSVAEVLFYRALLARAFFDTPHGAQEYAYIPEDLFKLLPTLSKEGSILPKNTGEPLGRPSTQKERGHPIPTSDRLLDDATTILAALRMGLPFPDTYIPTSVVIEFLLAAKIILSPPPPIGERQTHSIGELESGGKVLQTEAVKSFLEMPRPSAFSLLVNTWRESKTFNELRQIPGLIYEGAWSNQPLATREFLLNLLDAIPENTWWNLQAFIHNIKEYCPDFQRPAGDYDSWFIKRASDDKYLRGFDTWDEVDGALIRYLITGPLYWLGLVELATSAGSDIVSAFRYLKNASRTLTNEKAKLHVSSQGVIVVPRFLPRTARYQIARFCEWDKEKLDEYRYRVTTGSLKKAAEQGLKVNQLLKLLAKNAATEIPPVFVKALKRWELNGTEARVELQTVLRVGKPEILEELYKSKAGRFLGETLGPVTVVIKPGAQSKVLSALAEMGVLAEDLMTVDRKGYKGN